LATGTQAGEGLAQSSKAAFIHALGQGPTGSGQSLTQQCRCRRVAVFKFLAVSVQNEHGLGGHLKQQAVTGFGMLELPVITLHGALSVEQLLLQGRLWPQVTPESQRTRSAIGVARGNPDQGIRQR
jgi:hypothetical protein